MIFGFRRALLIFCLVFAPYALACRPSADHRYPTLEENFKRAKAVYVGRITSIKAVGKKSLVTMDIQKAWKNSAPKETITVMTNEPSSCDRMNND